MDRYLELTHDSLLYYKHNPSLDKTTRAPILTIPFSAILEARTLYQKSDDNFFFEIMLKTEYEHLSLMSSIRSHFEQNKVGGRGFSKLRLSMVPLKEMLHRVMPGSVRVTKDGVLMSP